VHMEARTFGQPRPNQGGLVGPVVVDDQVHLEFEGDIGVDGVEKFAELSRTMRPMTLANYRTSIKVERREQAVPWRA
jgi:hypothetical protein